MAKIVYDDGREENYNEEDFISRDELDENYISKEEVEENYVSREKYEKKSKQARNAFANQDKAKQEALAEREAELEKSLEAKILFKTKHGLDEIPEEVIQARTNHPTLSWDEALKISGYEKISNDNPNPGRPNAKVFNPEKIEYTLEELAQLPQEQYNAVMERVDKGEVKKIA